MPRGPLIPEQVIVEAHARYVAGEPTSRLAREYGISQQGLNGAFRKRGLWRRPPGQAFVPFWTKERVTAAHRRYLAGERVEDIADEYGMGGWGLLIAFRRHGLLVRRPGRPVGSRSFRVAAAHEHIAAEGRCIGCDQPMGATSVA